MRLCDRHGCNDPGNCPAPKSPNSPDRWYFCQKHAAEYNAGWDYFAGLDAEDEASWAISLHLLEHENFDEQAGEGEGISGF